MGNSHAHHTAFNQDERSGKDRNVRGRHIQRAALEERAMLGGMRGRAHAQARSFNPASMTERRQRLLGALVSTVAGLLTAAMIYLHPEGLHVPAWVAYVACAAFVLAGLTLMAHEFALRRTHAWLVAACAASLLVPAAWIAFGPGVRKCSVSVTFLSSIGSDLMCRGVFGLGAVIVAALLVWIVLRALRQQSGKGP